MFFFDTCYLRDNEVQKNGMWNSNWIDATCSSAKEPRLNMNINEWMPVASSRRPPWKVTGALLSLSSGSSTRASWERFWQRCAELSFQIHDYCSHRENSNLENELLTQLGQLRNISFNFCWNQIRKLIRSRSSGKRPCLEVPGSRDVFNFDPCFLTNPFLDADLVKDLVKFPRSRFQQNWNSSLPQLKFSTRTVFHNLFHTDSVSQPVSARATRSVQHSGIDPWTAKTLNYILLITQDIDVAESHSKQSIYLVWVWHRSRIGLTCDSIFDNIYWWILLNAAKKPSGPWVCPTLPNSSAHMRIFWVAVTYDNHFRTELFLFSRGQLSASSEARI